MKANKSPDLYAFVHDAKRFALCSGVAIEQAPLQLYCSALVFAPENSIVRRNFKDNIPPWVLKKPRVQADWSAALQTLEGHSDSVSSVAYSQDSKQLVSGSWDQTLRLWDAVTGAVLQMLQSHSEEVSSVAFSPNDQQVMSGSHDERVRLWDAVTGALLQTLTDHSKGVWSVVWSVAFSPDGQQIVSGWDDETVRLWDTTTGAPLPMLEGNSSWVTSTSSSLYSKQLPLYVVNDWIVEGDKKTLWLPPDYRSPVCRAVRNGTLVLGYRSGRVSIFEFQEESKSL